MQINIKKKNKNNKCMQKRNDVWFSQGYHKNSEGKKSVQIGNSMSKLPVKPTQLFWYDCPKETNKIIAHLTKLQ